MNKSEQYANFNEILKRLELCTKSELEIIKEFIEEEIKLFNTPKK